MRLAARDKAKNMLAELNELGSIDESAYALPLDESKGNMTKSQLLGQQKQELQSGRMQIMAARHWLQMALQAETEDEANRLFDKANGFYWEAMHNAKGKTARLAKLPDLGGRPRSEDIDILIEAIDEIMPQYKTIIAAARMAISLNPRLMMRYGKSNDEYLRKIIRQRRKEKNRP